MHLTTDLRCIQLTSHWRRRRRFAVVLRTLRRGLSSNLLWQTEGGLYLDPADDDHVAQHLFHLITSFGTMRLDCQKRQFARTSVCPARAGWRSNRRTEESPPPKRKGRRTNVESEGKYQQVSRNLMKSKRSVCLSARCGRVIYKTLSAGTGGSGTFPPPVVLCHMLQAAAHFTSNLQDICERLVIFCHVQQHIMVEHVQLLSKVSHTKAFFPCSVQ